MAGLINKNFKEDVLIELSWIMNAIDDLNDKLGVETYEIFLIKHRVQPEEEKAISKFFILNINKLDHYTIEEIQDKISKDFYESTKKEWFLTNEVVEKLIELKRKQLDL